MVLRTPNDCVRERRSDIDSENLINTPWYLGNGERQDVIKYYSSIGSRILDFHWYQNR